MVAFPNCKINLGLNIISKRADGYHDLETVFYPVQIKDVIEVIEKEGLRFSISGLEIEGDQQSNLCLKAYYLLKKDFPQLPAVQLHLHKAIPIGAGLGGGSADGAFTLQLLNKIFDLSLSEKKLMEYAMQLGSDCPFFILNKPCFGSGRGELIEQINLDLSAYKILIVHPGIHINTGRAFTNIKPVAATRSLKEIIQQPVSTWKQELKNDFEEPVFAQYPEIKKIKDELYKTGAFYSSMSGSGSVVYGIFEIDRSLSYSFPKNYFVRELAG